MDVSEIRRRNLLQLIAEIGRGGLRTQADVARELDMAPSYLAQLKSGKKMGDTVARKLEITAGKPHGWLDIPQWDADARAASSRAVNEEPPPPYGQVCDQVGPLTPEEIALVLNYRAADERTRRALSAAATAGAEPLKSNGG